MFLGKTTTHHHSRHTDPDEADDVELLVEEVCYCSEAVLKSVHTIKKSLLITQLKKVMILKTELYCHCVVVKCNDCWS